MLTVSEFQQQVTRTDRRPPSETTRIAVMGVFGELGSLMSEFKKRAREGSGYVSFDANLVEEAGDLLWYFTALAKDIGFDLHEILGLVWETPIVPQTTFANLDNLLIPISTDSAFDPWLAAATQIGGIARSAQTKLDPIEMRSLLIESMKHVFVAMRWSKISLTEAAESNLEKSISRFPLDRSHLALYDDRLRPNGEKIPVDERLPKRMDFDFREVRVRGKIYVVQKVYQIKIGDPLTDNIGEEDDYRFHDVFHLAYAAILGWSPVLRALLKLKRKSFADLDENEDGARAILIEEGISTLVFNAAKPHYFKGREGVDYTLLKTIKNFVRGYEVQDQPFWAWEKAILRGYEIFRELTKRRSGRVTIDLIQRDIYFAESSKQ